MKKNKDEYVLLVVAVLVLLVAASGVRLCWT